MESIEGDELGEVAAHGQSVWRLIVRILGNDGQDAADCFQQAFVELASRHRRMNDIRDAGPLLRRIATARAIDSVRRRIRDRRQSRAMVAHAAAAHPRFEPGAQVQAIELLDDLRSALAELPEAQAAAFVLTRIDNMPHDQAARAIGVSANHLAVLLHRASVTLRQRLASHSPVRE